MRPPAPPGPRDGTCAGRGAAYEGGERGLLMLGKLLVLAAVILLVVLGWKRFEGMARKARSLGRRRTIDLERDPESGTYRDPSDR